MTPVLGAQHKFSLDTFQELSLPSSQQGFIDSTFTTLGNGGCQCDNMLLEAHYTVAFEQSSTTPTEFTIKSVVVDVVYGQMTQQTCGALAQVSRKTSWTFVESVYSRSNSGGPGYVKGHNLLTGVAVQNANLQSYVNMTKGAFRLRGADNNGNCVYLNSSTTPQG